MAFTIIVGLLFLGVVFVHWLQGFFSAAISAVIAVLAAVLAFSWHEYIVDKLLKGQAANIAHAMVLVALFAAIYLILRIIFDKAVPNGITLPNALDRVGGGLMGLVAAAFSVGIFAIAVQELPFGPAVAGYTKYDAADIDAQQPGTSGGGQNQRGSNFDELHSNVAGSFDEADRKQMFPMVIPGVDEIVTDAVYHLSSTGSLQGSQPLADVHPDFLQEMFGQRIGIQAGAQHVTMNIPGAPEKAVVIGGLYTLTRFSADGVPPSGADARKVDGQYYGARPQGVTAPVKSVLSKSVVTGKIGTNETKEGVDYIIPASDKMMFLVVRITFGPDAADKHELVRISPGSIRLVAQFKGTNGAAEPHDYYPLGMLEPGKPYPMIYVDKPDDYLFVQMPRDAGHRAGVDAVFLVEKDLVVSKDKKKIADPNAFIEVKRMFHEDLGDKAIKPWTPGGANVTMGTLHQLKIHDVISGMTGRYSADVAKDNPTPAPVAPSTPTPAAPTPGTPTTPAPAKASLAPSEVTHAEALVIDIHRRFQNFDAVVGQLTPDQKGKLADIESQVFEKVRANPSAYVPNSPNDTALLSQFRGILTPEQQAKFDPSVVAQTQDMIDWRSGKNLNLIGQALKDYVEPHGGVYPPSLGAIVSPALDPILFLSGNTTVVVPSNWSAMDSKQQADWVNKNSDFAYAEPKLPFAKIPHGQVLAYVKNAAAKTNFLVAPAIVVPVSKAISDKLIPLFNSGRPVAITPQMLTPR
jgi:hypothetical protein